MELLDTFIPPTIDFSRQRIEQEKEAKPRYGASGAADVLTAAAMSAKPKASSNAIYGSVSTADIAATLKAGLSHNDEAARVIVNEADIRFVDGTEEGDARERVEGRRMGRDGVQGLLSSAYTEIEAVTDPFHRPPN